jgi:hypothetical protein
MAYDEDRISEHYIALNDFGANADNVVWVKGPPGYQGDLLDVQVSVTEAFACTSTAAAVQVGTGADADAYAQLNIADGTLINTLFNIADDTDAIISPQIPADTEIKVTMLQSVDDSSDTGTGHVKLVIRWHD